MRKLVAVMAAFVLLGTVGAAHANHLHAGPGAIGPASPFYMVDTTADRIGLALGLTNASTIAQERAAEVRAAAERNNTRAMQKAAKQFNAVAKAASADDRKGLETAAAVLRAVMEQAPAEAQQGLQTALDNVQRAQERVGGNVSAPQEPGMAPNQTEPGAAPNGTGPGSAPENGSDEQPSGANASTGQPDVTVVPDPQAAITIHAENSAFTSNATVAPGDTVMFKNDDGYGHTVTLDGAGIDQDIAGGANVTLQFNEPGSYTVDCAVHADMQTTVTVEEDVSPSKSMQDG